MGLLGNLLKNLHHKNARNLLFQLNLLRKLNLDSETDVALPVATSIVKFSILNKWRRICDELRYCIRRCKVRLLPGA